MIVKYLTVILNKEYSSFRKIVAEISPKVSAHLGFFEIGKSGYSEKSILADEILGNGILKLYSSKVYFDPNLFTCSHVFYVH